MAIWCQIQLAPLSSCPFFFLLLACVFFLTHKIKRGALTRAAALALFSLYTKSLLAGDAYLLQRSYPSIQMAIPCKTSESSIRLETAPLLKMRSIEDLSLFVAGHVSLLQVLAVLS